MFRTVCSALVALTLISSAAHADERWGVVFLHGKRGQPEKLITALTGALAEAGYLVETPEMCWSAKRIYDRPYAECLDEIDGAIGRDRTRGATRVVLGGLDTGANAAIGYAARHRGIAGIMALSPAHSPERLATVPEIAASLTVARALRDAGRLDEPVALSDVSLGAKVPATDIRTTARIYLSWFDPDSAAVMPVNIKTIDAPLLWLCASGDPNQHGINYAYASAPKNALNRYTTLDSDQTQLPYLGIVEVLDWLKALRGKTPD